MLFWMSTWRAFTRKVIRLTVECALSNSFEVTVSSSVTSASGKACCAKGYISPNKRPYRVTTDSERDEPIAPNVLKRRFDDWQPNQAWVADLTYIHTRQGWLYLAVVLDLATRKIVGWSMSKRMKAALVCDALTMAYQQRHPDAGLIMHTDRGSQYASKQYRRLLKAYAMIASMSRKANCWDNGVPRTPGRRCSNRDESVASRILVAGPGSKLRRAAEVKSLGSERRRKGAVQASSVG